LTSNAAREPRSTYKTGSGKSELKTHSFLCFTLGGGHSTGASIGGVGVVGVVASLQGRVRNKF